MTEDKFKKEFYTSLALCFDAIGFYPTESDIDKLIIGKRVKELERGFYKKIYNADHQGSMFSGPIKYKLAREIKLLIFLQEALDYNSDSINFVIGLIFQMQSGDGIYGDYEVEKSQYDKLKLVKKGFQFNVKDGNDKAIVTIEEVLSPYTFKVSRIWTDGQIDTNRQYSFANMKELI